MKNIKGKTAGWYQIGQSEESDEGIGWKALGNNPAALSTAILKKM